MTEIEFKVKYFTDSSDDKPSGRVTLYFDINGNTSRRDIVSEIKSTHKEFYKKAKGEGWDLVVIMSRIGRRRATLQYYLEKDILFAPMTFHWQEDSYFHKLDQIDDYYNTLADFVIKQRKKEEEQNDS